MLRGEERSFFVVFGDVKGLGRTAGVRAWGVFFFSFPFFGAFISLLSFSRGDSTRYIPHINLRPIYSPESVSSRPRPQSPRSSTA
ncbi:hypothetical protein EDB85DRAFT_2290304 [Lactarius pseudohatsudake]|nr:hypothetical protein EDB85DRAFT_2290304 [Lactarius pseudohatsudake]